MSRVLGLAEPAARRSRRPVALLAALTVVAAGCGKSSAPTGSRTTNSDFPESIYPAPRLTAKPDGGPYINCPSLDGVQEPGSQATEEILPILWTLGTLDELTDLRNSDRAWWDQVKSVWSYSRSSSPTPPSPQSAYRLQPQDVRSGPAVHSNYADPLVANCGPRTVDLSWRVEVCWTEPKGCEHEVSASLTGHLILLNRRGHWLIWWTK